MQNQVKFQRNMQNDEKYLLLQKCKQEFQQKLEYISLMQNNIEKLNENNISQQKLIDNIKKTYD